MGALHINRQHNKEAITRYVASIHTGTVRYTIQKFGSTGTLVPGTLPCDCKVSPPENEAMFVYNLFVIICEFHFIRKIATTKQQSQGHSRRQPALSSVLAVTQYLCLFCFLCALSDCAPPPRIDWPDRLSTWWARTVVGYASIPYLRVMEKIVKGSEEYVGKDASRYVLPSLP